MSRQRVALIAGGTSGIGYASAIALAAAGTAVVLGGRDPEKGKAAAAAVTEQTGVDAISVTLDSTDDDSVRRAVTTAAERFGGLDIIVHSVGSAPAGSVEDVEASRWLDAFDQKVIGAQRLMSAALPLLRESSAGRIVLIAGSAGKEPDAAMAVAGTMNGALTTLGRAAATHVAADGITVNVVSPGPTATTRWDGLVAANAARLGVEIDEAREILAQGFPRGRPATPAEVSAAVAFFASEAAGFVTGTNLIVDGGQARGV